MYASELDRKKLTFFVSGKLWGHSLVMGDKETNSEWSHILGQAMAGKLKGKSLTIIPSVMTNWDNWRTRHPSTTATAISQTPMQFTTENLRRNSPRFGFGLVHHGKARFWRFDRLHLEPVVNDSMADLKLVVHFDIPTRTPVAWNRQLVGDPSKGTSAARLLNFRSTARGVQDVQTESIWDLRIGTAIDGPLKGTRLSGVPAIVSYTNAWSRFHPDSSIWQPK